MEPRLTSLLYVSDSLLDASSQEDELGRIVALSRARNPTLGVTGALVFTGAHFAQVLEGAAAELDDLMSSICADPRHSNVDFVEVVEADSRRFADWGLAYSGPCDYVDKHIRPLFKQVAEPRTRIAATRSLIRLMVELTAVGGVHQPLP